MPTNWGAVFDFDGVVFDTEWHHEVCWQQVAKELGRPLTHEQYVAGFGVKNERFIAEILGWTCDLDEIKQIAGRKEELFQAHAKVTPINLVDGLEAFLQHLEKEGVPCVIASSSILKNIEIILDQSPVKHYFSKIVSAEDVTLGKPHPDCFIKAAQKIERPPERCVVFEDALLGVEAAKKAGSKVIALTTTFAKERFQQLPYSVEKIVTNFGEVAFEELYTWFE